MQVDPAAAKIMLTHMLKPWHEAIADPSRAQEAMLHKLIADYAKTEYGKQHGAAHIETLEDYRRAFPVTPYEAPDGGGYKPMIERVMGGEVELLLWEEPIGWAITRGTTKGESKFIPMTSTDLALRVSAGRAVTMRRYLTWSGVRDGLVSSINATTPEVTAVAMLVPFM